tara:strand:- start:332 stop:565 length:234 start_codon:yes stop_codon:yes gene_type:complete
LNECTKLVVISVGSGRELTTTTAFGRSAREPGPGEGSKLTGGIGDPVLPVGFTFGNLLGLPFWHPVMVGVVCGREVS